MAAPHAAAHQAGQKVNWKHADGLAIEFDDDHFLLGSASMAASAST